MLGFVVVKDDVFLFIDFCIDMFNSSDCFVVRAVVVVVVVVECVEEPHKLHVNGQWMRVVDIEQTS